MKDTMAVRTADYLADLHKTILNTTIDLNTRLVSWLVAGNAGAMVLVVNALISHPDHALALNFARWSFVAGLVAAFVGYTVLLINSLLSTRWVGGMRSELEQMAQLDETDPPQAHDEAFKKLEAAAKPWLVSRILIGLTWLLLALSAGCFIRGAATAF